MVISSRKFFKEARYRYVVPIFRFNRRKFLYMQYLILLYRFLQHVLCTSRLMMYVHYYKMLCLLFLSLHHLQKPQLHPIFCHRQILPQGNKNECYFIKKNSTQTIFTEMVCNNHVFSSFSNLLSVVDARGAVGGSPGGAHSHSGDGCADKRDLEATDNPLEQLNISNFLNSIGLDQLKVRCI